MKLFTTYDYEKRRWHKENWQRWFAWHPVVASDGQKSRLVWLQSVERKEYSAGINRWWEYKV